MLLNINNSEIESIYNDVKTNKNHTYKDIFALEDMYHCDFNDLLKNFNGEDVINNLDIPLPEFKMDHLKVGVFQQDYFNCKYEKFNSLLKIETNGYDSVKAVKKDEIKSFKISKPVLKFAYNELTLLKYSKFSFQIKEYISSRFDETMLLIKSKREDYLLLKNEIMKEYLDKNEEIINKHIELKEDDNIPFVNFDKIHEDINKLNRELIHTNKRLSKITRRIKVVDHKINVMNNKSYSLIVNSILTYSNLNVFEEDDNKHISSLNKLKKEGNKFEIITKILECLEDDSDYLKMLKERIDFKKNTSIAA